MYQSAMREWRNRQTRTFEGRVSKIVRVQVPSFAPNLKSTIDFLNYTFYNVYVDMILFTCFNVILIDFFLEYA